MAPASRFLWLMALVCAALELYAHCAIRNAVPEDNDFERAAVRLRQDFLPGDAISAAPPWIDPLVRKHVGDLIPLAMAGRSDLSAYGRLWTLSIRGARAQDAPHGPPEQQAVFGGVTLTRHRLPPPTLLTNLVTELLSAQVRKLRGNQEKQCRLVRGRPGRGGGLGQGTVPPAERFECGRGRDAMVAAVVIEDLALAPRYCVWHPALAGRVIKVAYPNVLFAAGLVFDAGLYYEHERDEAYPPVVMRVRVDGQELGKMVHKDGEGFRRLVIPTEPGSRGQLEIEVSSRRRRNPGFCWAASVRSALP